MAKSKMATDFPDALAHSSIALVVENIFLVTGANIVDHNGVRIQTSRTMTIIRQEQDLILVNSIRLNDGCLRELKKLGDIKHVIRLGAFHGRDDAFYQRTYGAQLWAFPEMDFCRGEHVDHDLAALKLPIVEAKIIVFNSTRFKEGLIYLQRNGGILISCDSIKNWQEQDQFFSEETFSMMKSSGTIGPANIDLVWLNAMKPLKEELMAISDHKFSILISAHGQPLISDAKAQVNLAIKQAVSHIDK